MYQDLKMKMDKVEIIKNISLKKKLADFVKWPNKKIFFNKLFNLLEFLFLVMK